MFIFIPTTRHTAKVTKTISKTRSCEKCSSTFDYSFDVQAQDYDDSLLWGQNDSAEQKATRKAVKKLEKAIAKANPLHACPSCGWYQNDMVLTYRRNRFPGLLMTGSVLMGLFLFAAFIAYSFFSDMGWLALCENVFLAGWFWIFGSIPTTMLLVVIWGRLYSNPNRSSNATGSQQHTSA